MNYKSFFLCMLTFAPTVISARSDDFSLAGRNYSPKTLEGELCKRSYESIFDSFTPERAKRDLLILAAVKCYNNLRHPDEYDHKILQKVLDTRDSWFSVKRTQLAAQYYVLTRSNRLLPSLE